ncbi:MAG: DUF120 domain-containing protein [Candidatus Aenigmarchaeota archaeon]|nr:DUF120 domain-containing protein [Candidatus Aenigmarchaeota archaeon]
MILRGRIVAGPMRGEGLVEHFHYRIVHALGFEPYKGTLDVKIDGKFHIEDYATKVIDHVLLDGRTMTDAYLCPATVRKGDKHVKAWIIRKPKDIHGKDMLEILSKERIKDELGLADGDMVEIDIQHAKVKKSDRRRHLAMRFRRKKQDIPHLLSGDTTLMKR